MIKKKMKKMGLAMGSLMLVMGLASCSLFDTDEPDETTPTAEITPSTDSSLSNEIWEGLEGSDVATTQSLIRPQILKDNEEATTSAEATTSEESTYADTTAPSLSDNSTIYVDIDNPYTLSELLTKVQVYDDMDPKSLLKIKLVDTTYELDEYGKISAGTYSLTFTATDTSGNSSELTCDVVVKAIPMMFDMDNPTALVGKQINNISCTFTDTAVSFPAISADTIEFTFDINMIANGSNTAYKLRYYYYHSATQSIDRYVAVLYSYDGSEGFDDPMMIPEASTDEELILFDSSDLSIKADYDFSSIATITSVQQGWKQDYSTTLTSFSTCSDLTEYFPCSVLGFRNKGDIYAPTILNEEKIIYINVDKNIPSIETLLNEYIVYSDDSACTTSLVGTTYDPDDLTIGQHTFNFKVIDASGNATADTFTLIVYDTTAPVISGPNSYEVEYDEPITIDDIMSKLVVSDNYDDDLTITIVSDSYTGNEKVVGVHPILFTAVDSSSNKAQSFKVDVQVNDTQIPIVIAPCSIDASSNYKITAEELQELIYVYDGLDGAITYEIDMSEYQENYNRMNTYEIIIKATDKNNNVATHIINTRVTDELVTGFEAYNYMITISDKTELTETMVKSYLEQVNLIAVSDVKNINTDLEQKAGLYDMIVLSTDGDILELKVKVIGDAVAEKENSYWDNWKNFSDWGLAQWFTILIVAGGLYLIVNTTHKKKRR